MARFALAVAAVLGFLLTAALANLLAPALAGDQNGGAAPAGGGTALALGVLGAVGAAWLGLAVMDPLLLQNQQRQDLMLALAAALAYGAVGLLDDALRRLHRRRKGLRGWQLLALQALVTACFLAGLYYTESPDTQVLLPFFGLVQLGEWYWPASFALILALLNGANVTDGAPGACGICGFASALALVTICALLNDFSLAVCAAALAGALLALLWWNFPPAKLSLGRSGSQFLAGCLVALCYSMGRPGLLLLLGGVYLLEGASLLAQGLWLRLRKKPLFAAAPPHRAMAGAGHSPARIAATLGCGGGVCALLALLLVYLH